MTHTYKIVPITLGLAVGLAGNQLVLAQASDAASFELEEVTVTAEKREENLQSTAISIVALSGAELESAGRNNMREVLATVGGVSFSGAGQGAVHINMRGVEGSTAMPGRTDAGASINMDGVVLSNLLGDASSAAFYDIARVEVLRGPQGTLYGRGAVGGAVNVVTNNPVDTFELAGTIEMGNYDLQHLGGMINVPLNGSWALRAAYNSIQRDGYYTSGLDAADASSSRLKLRYDGGALSALVGAEVTLNVGPLGAGFAGSGIPAWGNGDPPTDAWDDVSKNGGLSGTNRGSTQDNKLSKIWSQIDWNTDIGTLTLIPSYSNVLNDATIVVTAMSGATSVANQYTQVHNITDGDAKSFEARFASPADSALKWVLGAYYDTATAYIFQGQFGSREIWQDQSSVAGFAQLTVPLGEKWAVLGGLRQTKDEKSFSTRVAAAPLNFNTGARSWSRTDWKLGLQGQLNSTSLVYLTAATGYRPGGVDTGAGSSTTVTNVAGQQVPNLNQFSKPEYLTTLELGSKNEFLNRRLRLNGSVYVYDYKDPQFFFITSTADPTANCPNGAAPTAGVAPGTWSCSSMLNAAGVRTVGAEMDALWLLTEHDRVSLSASYLSAKVNEHSNVALSIPPGSTVPPSYSSNVSGSNIILDAKGAQTPRSPKSQANAYYQHDFDLGGGTLWFRGDVRYTGETYLGGFSYLNPVIRNGIREGDLYVIAANTKYDASIGFESTGGKWTLNIYGRNLTNEAVKSFTAGTNTAVEPPRTFGVVLTARL